MTATVLLFAAAKELAGRDAVAVELPAVATVADVRVHLAAGVPAIASLLGRCVIAVNHEVAEDGRVLKSTDEIAVIPPVSGG